ncbi:MAG: NAD(P)H oxidoreductase [Actinobacteria bacterium]|nr:NAD(P)H oxidoreductase [Actinomycetota bacterium]
MTTKLRAHLVWSHPREESLTSSLVRAINDSLVHRGYDVDELDLYRAGFDPVLREPDEPDWDNPQKSYSPIVEELAGRVQRADVIVVVFPLWWYAMPAMLKGYVDRVWNHGRMYGDTANVNASAVLWVALAGLDRLALDKRGHIDALERQLNDGIADYCGIETSRTLVLDDTIDNPNLADSISKVETELERLLDGIRG